MSSIDTGYAAAPHEDDFELEALPVRRRRLPLLTAVLVAALVAAGAFVGGVEAQKHYGTSASAAASGGTGGAAALAARRRGGGSPTFFGGGPASAESMTAGLITVIRGSTLYVTDFNGNTVKVKASGVKVTKTVTAALRSLHPGDSVVVQGKKQKDGSYKASSITVGALGGGNG
jgi:hypothetical protein